MICALMNRNPYFIASMAYQMWLGLSRPSLRNRDDNERRMTATYNNKQHTTVGAY
jgi:hypothetical protein